MERSVGLRSLLVMNLMRRMYIYTHTISVRNTVAKKGAKIAIRGIGVSSGNSSSLIALRILTEIKCSSGTND
jgi:hypothetical protein